MNFDPTIHHRRSIRLKGRDYAEPGLYFVTICTHGKRCLFGRVSEGKVLLNPAGEAVRRAWLELPTRFPTVVLDAFVVMPNHVHGVLALVRPLPERVLRESMKQSRGAASSAPTDLMPTLGKIMRAFKSLSAIHVNRLLRRRALPVWQRNYYEHIVRNSDDLADIQHYIALNPSRWDEDPENANKP